MSELDNKMYSNTLALIFLAALLIAGCSDSNNNSDSSEDDASRYLPVEVEIVRTGDLLNFVVATGTVYALYDADVSAETSGRVTEIVRQVGSYVESGQVVVTLDEATQILNLQQSRARLKIAEAAHSKAERDLERMERLFADGDISISEIEQARLLAQQSEGEHELAEATTGLAEKAFDDTRIGAPFDGEITAVYVDVGEAVALGQIVYTVVQTDTVKIKVDVSAADIALVHSGLPAEISTTVFPDTFFAGEVSAVAVKSNQATRTYLVEVLAENYERSLRPGLLADVRIVTGREANAIAIPLDAILRRNGKDVVFVEQNGISHMREVEISSERGSEAVIASGLSAGEKLIVVGQHNLRDGQKVLITE